MKSVMARGIFHHLTDEQYLKLAWKVDMGGKLNLQNPKTFNEKLQWLKLNDRKSLYTQLVDKYEAKHWVANLIGDDYIIPTYGIWENFDDINFEKLPKQFVIKCTHDSCGLVICKDKSRLNIGSAQNKINKSLRRNYYYRDREWPYKDVKPRIIVEKFMSDGRTLESGLTDFKFFCFSGHPKFLYVSQGLDNHATAKIAFYDLHGKKMWFKRADYHELSEDEFSLPKTFSEMVNVAAILAKNIPCPFVRIDLYEINGKVYFSEITFSPCGGHLPFSPVKADFELGKLLKLK